MGHLNVFMAKKSEMSKGAHRSVILLYIYINRKSLTIYFTPNSLRMGGSTVLFKNMSMDER